MRRESHVRFCESVGVKLPHATHLLANCSLYPFSIPYARQSPGSIVSDCLFYLCDGEPSRAAEERVIFLGLREALIWLNEPSQDQGSFWSSATETGLSDGQDHFYVCSCCG